MKNLAIIGGGPAALMLAAQLDMKKYKVSLFEKTKTVGRKFLVAGVGGLNFTFNEPLDSFISQYYPSDFMAPAIKQFTNEDLIAWFNSHEIPTFIGTSNRVFPDFGLKPIEVLNRIVEYVKDRGVDIQLNSKWLGWNQHGQLRFEDLADADFDIVVFAMGGASWKVTGSDGHWAKEFKERGIKLEPFKPVNCSFNVDWNKNLLATHKGKALKNISLTYNGLFAKGELVITKFGLEGNAIYALSYEMQKALESQKSIVIHLDLKPTMSVEALKAKYERSLYTKVTDVLREDLNLERASIGLLKQFTDRDTFLNPDKLVSVIKSIPVVIKAADDLDKAISSIGGVSVDAVDMNFQLKKIPNAYAIGEMLDWFAPTGGYLLQGCFSMGFTLAKHLNEKEV